MTVSTRLLKWTIAAALGAIPLAAAADSFFDDGNVLVREVHFQPGDVGKTIARPPRVIRVLKGGTIRRTYPDGHFNDVQYKTGETRVYHADPVFGIRNVGNTEIVFFVVAIRHPQK